MPVVSSLRRWGDRSAQARAGLGNKRGECARRSDPACDAPQAWGAGGQTCGVEPSTPGAAPAALCGGVTMRFPSPA